MRGQWSGGGSLIPPTKDRIGLSKIYSFIQMIILLYVRELYLQFRNFWVSPHMPLLLLSVMKITSCQTVELFAEVNFLTSGKMFVCSGCVKLGKY